MTCRGRSNSPICHVGKASFCPLRKVIFEHVEEYKSRRKDVRNLNGIGESLF